MAHAAAPANGLSEANFQRMQAECVQSSVSVVDVNGPVRGVGAGGVGAGGVGSSARGRSEAPRATKPVRARTRLPAPDGGVAAWSMVAGAFVVMMHSSSMHYITGIFYVAWLAEWPDASRAAVAGAGSLSTAVMFGSAYLSGQLQYQWKSQGAVVLLGAVLASLGLLAASYATTLIQLYWSYSVLMGVGHAFSFPPCPVLISTWFSSRTGAALGLTTAGASVGTIYLSVVASALIRAHGWRFALRWLAGLTLVRG
jgi:MFS family permease